jgi:hypothetical protein
MRHSLTLFTAAAIAVGGLAFVATAQDQPGVGQRAGDAVGQAGDRVRDTGDRLAAALDPQETVTEAALTKGGFNDVVQRLTEADRNRIGDSEPTSEQLDVLDGRIEQIRQAWQQKYNQDFAIDDRLVVFDDRFQVLVGEVSDRARVAGERVGDAPAPAPAPGVARDDRETRDVATVVFPESHNLPSANIPMVLERINLWKIDVPEQVDGGKLYDNLLNHLTIVGENVQAWPADVNDAYRLVSHHVMLAVMDIEPDHRADDAMDRDRMDAQPLRPAEPGMPGQD